MKRWKQFWIMVFVALITLLVLTQVTARAEIKNGYGEDISQVREALYSLYELLQEEDLTRSQRATVKGSIKALIDNIAYYQLTESVLYQFSQVAPEIYSEISNIRDRQGRPVDVFVSIVPINGTEVKAWGTTYIRQGEDDPDLYISSYGPGTVSIKIWAVPKVLNVLAHEFGHVKYQVPHLASYMNYYHEKYGDKRFSSYDLIGHDRGDPSGRIALENEKRFLRSHLRYLKKNRKSIKSSRLLLVKTKKELKKERKLYDRKMGVARLNST